MKTMNTLSKLTLSFLLFGALLFAACKKEGSNSNNDQTVAALTETTVNDTEADDVNDDVFNNTMGISASDAGEDLGITAGIGVFGRMENGELTGRVDSTNRCFTVTVSPRTPGVFPKTVTIDFGTGCIGKDGKLRKGKIITVFTNRMSVPGAKATTTFDGYKVDSAAVSGTHEVINNSVSNSRIFTRNVIAGQITWDSGRWVKWTTSRTITQLEGNGTPLFPLDDVFSISGSGSGENSKGNRWSHTILEPLIKRFACRWISKGVVNITFNNRVALLNYGNGDCDNKATITINGITKEITLPR
ncbi:MAG: hypothetical protein K2X48_09165 [Chitinophagaceae bacterium]|nr:hypothetical protein [Chitinophagaceae bacterium]